MKKSEFVQTAKPLTVTVNGTPLNAEPRQFKTGSVGYFLCGKVNVQLPDGTIAKVQVGGNFTVCHSKEWEQGEPLPVPAVTESEQVAA
jgi:hypothetical protein